MESQREEIKLSSRIHTKGSPPVVSSRLPDAFSNARKSRPRTRQQINTNKHVNKSKQDLQQELNNNEDRGKYQQAAKMLSPLKMDPVRKAKMEKVLSKIKKGLPNFKQSESTDLKTLKTPTVKLSEMITLSIVKGSRDSGAVKKVLHAPTLRIFAVKEAPLCSREIRCTLRD